MVRSYYAQGTHIVLVDVGHSYKGLCAMVDGYYFTYDEKNQLNSILFISAKVIAWIQRRKRALKPYY